MRPPAKKKTSAQQKDINKKEDLIEKKIIKNFLPKKRFTYFLTLKGLLFEVFDGQLSWSPNVGGLKFVSMFCLFIWYILN